MSQYNCNIENGLKSALFKLGDLKREEKISSVQLDAIMSRLSNLIAQAQNGEIRNSGNDE